MRERGFKRKAAAAAGAASGQVNIGQETYKKGEGPVINPLKRSKCKHIAYLIGNIISVLGNEFKRNGDCNAIAIEDLNVDNNKLMKNLRSDNLHE